MATRVGESLSGRARRGSGGGKRGRGQPPSPLATSSNATPPPSPSSPAQKFVGVIEIIPQQSAISVAQKPGDSDHNTIGALEANCIHGIRALVKEGFIDLDFTFCIDDFLRNFDPRTAGNVVQVSHLIKEMLTRPESMAQLQALCPHENLSARGNIINLHVLGYRHDCPFHLELGSTIIARSLRLVDFFAPDELTGDIKGRLERDETMTSIPLVRMQPDPPENSGVAACSQALQVHAETADRLKVPAKGRTVLIQGEDTARSNVIEMYVGATHQSLANTRINYPEAGKGRSLVLANSLFGYVLKMTEDIRFVFDDKGGNEAFPEKGDMALIVPNALLMRAEQSIRERSEKVREFTEQVLGDLDFALQSSEFCPPTWVYDPTKRVYRRTEDPADEEEHFAFTPEIPLGTKYTVKLRVGITIRYVALDAKTAAMQPTTGELWFNHIWPKRYVDVNGNISNRQAKPLPVTLVAIKEQAIADYREKLDKRVREHEAGGARPRANDDDDGDAEEVVDTPPPAPSSSSSSFSSSFSPVSPYSPLPSSPSDEQHQMCDDDNEE